MKPVFSLVLATAIFALPSIARAAEAARCAVQPVQSLCPDAGVRKNSDLVRLKINGGLKETAPDLLKLKINGGLKETAPDLLKLKINGGQ